MAVKKKAANRHRKVKPPVKARVKTAPPLRVVPRVAKPVEWHDSIPMMSSAAKPEDDGWVPSPRQPALETMLQRLIIVLFVLFLFSLWLWL